MQKDVVDVPLSLFFSQSRKAALHDAFLSEVGQHGSDEASVKDAAKSQQ